MPFRAMRIAVLCLLPLVTGLIVRLDPSLIGLKLDGLDCIHSFLSCLFNAPLSRNAFLQVIQAPYFDYGPSLLHICSSLSSVEDLQWLVDNSGLGYRLLADCIQLCPVATPNVAPEVNLLAARCSMHPKWSPEFFFRALQSARERPRMEIDLSRWIHDPYITEQHFDSAKWNGPEDQPWQLITIDLAENSTVVTNGVTQLAAIVAGPLKLNGTLSQEQTVLRLLNFCMLRTVDKNSEIDGEFMHVFNGLAQRSDAPLSIDVAFEGVIRELAKTARDWYKGYRPDAAFIALELLDRMPLSQWTGQLLLNLLHVIQHATSLSETEGLYAAKDAIVRRYLEIDGPLTKDLCSVMKLIRGPNESISGMNSIAEYLNANQSLASDAYRVCPDMLPIELKLSLPVQMRLEQTFKQYRKPKNTRYCIVIRTSQCNSPRDVLDTLLMGTWELLHATKQYNVELAIREDGHRAPSTIRPFTTIITMVLKAFMGVLEFYQLHEEADRQLCIVPTLRMHPKVVKLFAFFVGIAVIYRVPQQFRICRSYFDHIRDDSLPIDAQTLEMVYSDHSSLIHDGAVFDTLRLDDQIPPGVIMQLSVKDPRAHTKLPLPMELEYVVNGLLNSMQSFRAGLNFALDAENYSLSDLNDLLFGLIVD
jgi:hypothetical protein